MTRSWNPISPSATTLLARLCALVVLLVACSASVSSTRSVSAVAVGARDSLPRALLVGERRFALDSTTTIGDVASQLGHSVAVAHSGDTSWIAICDTIRHLRLVLLSDVLGGPSHRLLGFELHEFTPGIDADAGCAQATRGLGAVSTDNGLTIGLQQVELFRRLGSPTTSAGDSLEFVRIVPHSELRSAQSAATRDYDDFSRVIAVFREGRIVRLLVWFVRTT